MRHRILLIVLLLSLSACTFQVEMLTPSVEAPSLTPPTSETLTLTPPISLTPTTSSLPELPTQPPTATLPPLPTFTSTALPQGEGTYPIRFAPKATFIDVVDSISAGKSRTYSIRALEGQIMSISVRQSSEGEWTYIPIELKGADGTTFCPLPPFHTDCTFWRGVLPSTQDYFVTLTPVADALNFTMRVTINPPSVAKQTFKYVSKNGIASFFYDDDFAPARAPDTPIYKFTPEFGLQYIDTQAYTKTNLLEAYLLFGATSDSSIVQTCTQPASLGAPENVVGNVNINGVDFTRSEATGAATGNIYEQIYHRAAVNGACYEVIFFIHSTNIGVYAPGFDVKEFDHAALLQRFEDTLSTLVIQQ